jgi:broad specificity phosphatase PhoE
MLLHSLVRDAAAPFCLFTTHGRRRRDLDPSPTPPFNPPQIEHDEDRLWTAHHRETPAEMARRGVAFLQWLGSRPEGKVAVVTHSAFLLTMFTQVLHCHCPELCKWFENAEMRAVTLYF